MPSFTSSRLRQTAEDNLTPSTCRKRRQLTSDDGSSTNTIRDDPTAPVPIGSTKFACTNRLTSGSLETLTIGSPKSSRCKRLPSFFNRSSVCSQTEKQNLHTSKELFYEFRYSKDTHSYILHDIINPIFL